eukprot:TRINITY_DN13822_c0_g1_i1.p1 TRINITY_DN13822_c0_g1~~TRINITY_DN13822_c0_g1_i1.p1  ORF type:complete len:469 (-),score=106.28 TRINITY_DN13822_c0_g1_i1:82-1488(-)
MPVRDNSSFSLEQLRQAAANAEQELHGYLSSQRSASPEPDRPHRDTASRSPAHRDLHSLYGRGTSPSPSQSPLSPIHDVSTPLPPATATTTPFIRGFVPSVPTSPSTPSPPLTQPTTEPLKVSTLAADTRHVELESESARLQERASGAEAELAIVVAERNELQARLGDSSECEELTAQLGVEVQRRRDLELRVQRADARGGEAEALQETVHALQGQVLKLMDENKALAGQPGAQSELLKAQQALAKQRKHLEMDEKAGRLGIIHMERQLQQANRASALKEVDRRSAVEAHEAVRRGSGVQRALMSVMASPPGVKRMLLSTVVGCWHARSQLSGIKSAAESKKRLRSRTAIMQIMNTVDEAADNQMRTMLHCWQANAIQEVEDLNSSMRQDLEAENAALQQQIAAFEAVVVDIDSIHASSACEIASLRAALTEVTTQRDKGCAELQKLCLLYTSPSPRDRTRCRMTSSA